MFLFCYVFSFYSNTTDAFLFLHKSALGTSYNTLPLTISPFTPGLLIDYVNLMSEKKLICVQV